jgi:hypothetical protein
MKIRLNYFTNYNILLFCYNNYNNYNNLYYDDIYSISVCLTWIVFFSFHGSLLLDSSVFKKLRIKQNISYEFFHLGNILLHVLPFAFYIYYPPDNINFNHSCISIFIKFIWAIISTRGDLNLGKIYVPFSKKNIIKLYLISSISCFSAPIYYNLIKTISTS